MPGRKKMNVKRFNEDVLRRIGFIWQVVGFILDEFQCWKITRSCQRQESS